MGKSYQTAIPQFVQDKMFQLPVDLMFKAIEKTDKNIDDSLQKVDAFNGLLDIENLTVDNPEVNNRLSKYKDRINQLTTNINKSPLDYKRYRTDIASLSREIDNDLQRGLLGRAEEMKKKYDEEIDRVNKMEGVGNERKSLIKEAIKNKYKQAGALSYQDTNNYNDISEMFIDPLQEFDEEKFINTIGTNFEGDTSSSAWSNPDNEGYIRDGSKTVTIRSEEDVANYVRDSLSDGVWEAQKRQMYELKRDAGVADITDEQIDVLVEQDKNSLINRAKNKLGFKKESRTANTKTDGTYGMKWSAAQKQLEAGQGVILQEVRDPRNAIGGEFAATDAVMSATIDKKIKANLGYDSYQQLYDEVFTGANKAEKIKNLRQKLLNEGILYNNFVTYMNYQFGVEKLETPHPDEYDPNNPDDIKTQQNLLNGIVTGINNRNPNEEVKRIRVSTPNGQYYELPYNSVGELVSDRDSNFVYIPATSKMKKNVWKKSPTGDLVNKDGSPILNPKNNKPIKSYDEAVIAGVAGNLVMDIEEIPSYDTNEVLFKADKGNTKQVNQKRIDVYNREKNEKEYVVTNSYFRINPTNGKYEVVNVDVYLDANKINVKQ